MTINVKNLEFEIGKEIDKISSSTSNEDLLKFSSALKQLNTGAVISVQNFSNLPTVTANNTGQIGYVESSGILYYAKAGTWEKLFIVSEVTQQLINASILYSWGFNSAGDLGDGSSTNRSSPGTTAGGGTTWCQVSGSSCNAIAVKSDGTLWTWGCAGSGALGDGTSINRCSPGTTAGSGTNWCQASMGYASSVAIKTNGTLWTWGRNTCGALGDGTSINRSSPGTTAGTGTTWCSAKVGYLFMGAIKTDGTLWTWGRNTFGQLGDGSTTNRCSPVTVVGGGTDWCQVSAGSSFTAAIKTDGTLWTWGCNVCSVLGTNSTISRSSPGTTIGGGTTWCQVDAGNMHTGAIKTDGTLWTWGCNYAGALGDGSTINRSSPITTAGGGTNWCQVSTEFRTQGAVKTDGTLWTWGSNLCGGLGTGNTVSRSSPGTTIAGGTGWCQVEAGRGAFAIQVESIVITT
jgi:alpha-tubulin suppressor-like RCC1 family protein